MNTKRKKPYKDKTWMQAQYIEKELSIAEIARQACCSWACIRRWLDKHDIPIRTKEDVSRIFLDGMKIEKEWLYQKYVEEELSTFEIADLLGCSVGIVRRRLKRFGIHIRTRMEATKIRRKKDFVDRVGEKYGKLTIIGYVGLNKYDSNVWKCKCECGTEVDVPYSSLSRGASETCGCSRIYRMSQEEAAFNRLLNQYKNNARNKGVEFHLTKQQFRELTNGNCYYCGCRPSKKKQTHNKHTKGYYLYNGIDRLDSTGGYVVDNVVSCCKQCNLAKRRRSPKEFLLWIDRVYEHRARKIRN